MRVISFYTVGGGSSYEREAEILRESLDRFGIEHTIEAIQAWGDWYDHTAHKAGFIENMRSVYSGPLLWIDSDAVVHEDVQPYFEGLVRDGFDFGVHYFRGPGKGFDKSQIRKEGWRLLSGTTFWADTPMARRLLQTWTGLNAWLRGNRIRRGGGQKNLWLATQILAKERLQIARLPGSYCWVFDKPWAYLEGEYPIIEHTIASRDHRATRRETKERKARIAELEEARK